MKLYIGDIIFQMIVFLIPIIFIILCIVFFRSSKRRTEQLKRIEEKLDRVSEQNYKELD